MNDVGAGIYYAVEGAGKEVYTNLAVVLKPTAVVWRARNWEEKLHMKQEREKKQKTLEPPCLSSPPTSMKPEN